MLHSSSHGMPSSSANLSLLSSVFEAYRDDKRATRGAKVKELQASGMAIRSRANFMAKIRGERGSGETILRFVNA